MLKGVFEHVAALMLGGTLLLPAPGTTSRERGFCSAWLSHATPAKQEVLRAAEEAERESASQSECRSRHRAGLRHLLDAECKNWAQLMDFEVRLLVDRLLRPCRADPPS